MLDVQKVFIFLKRTILNTCIDYTNVGMFIKPDSIFLNLITNYFLRAAAYVSVLAAVLMQTLTTGSFVGSKLSLEDVYRDSSYINVQYGSFDVYSQSLLVAAVSKQIRSVSYELYR